MSQLRFQEARSAFDKALAIEPDNPYTWSNYSGLLRTLGRLDEAGEFAGKAAQRLVNEPLVLLNHFLIEQERDHLAQAISGYQQLATRWPELPAVHYHLGQALVCQGEFAAAETSLSRCLMLDLGHDAAFQSLVACWLGQRQFALALAYLEQRLATRPYNGYTIALRCIAQRNLMRTDEAAVLDDPSRWLRCYHMDRPPQGFAALADFNQALLAHVEAHPELGAYSGQATIDGQRLNNLLEPVTGPTPVLAHWILQQLRDYLAWVRTQPHPFGKAVDATLALRGWAILLRTGGYETPHLHPGGFISCVYYPSVPDVVSDSADQAGNLVFGEPDPLFLLDQPGPMLSLTPAQGMLAVFPSWLWHHTVPFSSEQPRLSLAFDLYPQ